MSTDNEQGQTSLEQVERLAEEAKNLPPEARAWGSNLLKSLTNLLPIAKSEAEEGATEVAAEGAGEEVSKAILADGKAPGFMESVDSEDEDGDGKKDEDEDEDDEDSDDENSDEDSEDDSEDGDSEDSSEDDSEDEDSDDEANDDYSDDDDEDDDDTEVKKSLMDDLVDMGIPASSLDAAPVLDKISKSLSEVTLAQDDMAATVEDLIAVTKSLKANIAKEVAGQLKKSLTAEIVKSLKSEISSEIKKSLSTQAEEFYKSMNREAAPVQEEEGFAPESAPVNEAAEEAIRKSVSGSEAFDILNKSFEMPTDDKIAAAKTLTRNDLLKGLHAAALAGEIVINATELQEIGSRNMEDLPEEYVKAAQKHMSR